MKHGVEQEIQVVNENGRLVYEADKIIDRVPDRFLSYGKGGVYKDVYPSQLEIATDACETLEELERQLLELREAVNKAASENDLFLIATGANPYTKGKVGEYFAEQHHLDAPTNEDKLRLNNFLRIFVPELFAISVNSPIHENDITRWKSVRASMNTYDVSNRVNPNIKTPPYLTLEDVKKGLLPLFAHEKSYEESRKKSRYYDVSPFTKKYRNEEGYKPTLEVRLFDTQPSVPLTLAYGALLQALVLKSKKIRWIPKFKIEHNRNYAIKDGLSCHFIYSRDEKRYYHYKNLSDKSAVSVVRKLMKWVGPEISELGYKRYLDPIKRLLKHKRNLADRQVHLFLNKRNEFNHELFQSTMEDFDNPPLAKKKISFKFVNREEGRKSIKWDPEMKKAYDSLLKSKFRPYSIEFRTLANVLLSLIECNPNLKTSEVSDHLNILVKKHDEDNFYSSLLLLETLFEYEKTNSETYRSLAEQVTSRTNSGALEKDQVWLNAYALTVVSKIVGEEFDKKKHTQKLKERIGDIPLWVLAYTTEALVISGVEATEELGKLKIALKDDHWECDGLEDEIATAIIYNCMNNIGYRNEKVINWLKESLKSKNFIGKKGLFKKALMLRALSGEVLE